tara:strand:+ start:801 stop:5948 length:5148 start_codon:yes stop_codon:yes gene_type:complete
MSVTIQNSNIVINDGTSDFILEHMKTTGTRKNNTETNTPTISPYESINEVSKIVDDKYIMFTYDLNKTYNKISADEKNLIAWYKLDNGWYDSSGYDKHLTQYSPSSNGFYDDTAFFSGSTYYEVENDGYFSPKVFSISVWVELAGTGDAKALASCRGTSPSKGWIIYKYNKDLHLWYFGGSPSGIIISNIFTGGWKHIVITTLTTSSEKCNTNIYVNGKNVYSNTNITYIVNTENSLRIGAGKNETTATYFLENKSLMRDFRMYNIVLTAADVAILYNNNNSNSPVLYEKDKNNLVIWNKFIGNQTDSSGNSNNLVATGTVTYDTQNYVFNQSSVYLSGDTYFTSPTSIDMYKIWLIRGITLSGWFKAAADSDDWAGIYEINLDSNNRLGITKNGTNNNLWIGKIIDGSTYNINEVISSSTFFNDIWHHLVFTIDDYGNWQVYLNNVKIYTATGQKPLSTFKYLNIGNSLGSANRHFKGNIDDFRLYDTVLTEEEVEKLYYRSCQNYYRDMTKYTLTFPEDTSCDILVVGGGGGGGMDIGGGGGAGGYVYTQNYSATANTPITIYIGDGGAGAPGSNTFGQNSSHNYNINAKKGYNSSFGDIISYGGGYGGSSHNDHPLGGYATDGGSGGGGGGYLVTGRQGMGISSQGNNGGGGTSTYYPGGGGGAGEVGGSGTVSGAPKGGDGLYNDIMGTGYYWAGGGGGGGYNTTGGNGGLGGGGGGAINTTYGGTGYNDGESGGGGGTKDVITHPNTPGGSAGRHTGGGGGGGTHYQGNNKGGGGGSGIVIVRYKSIYEEYDYDPQWKHNEITPTINFLGNVGIGTKSSSDKTLNINGDINISGNIYSINGLRNFSKKTYNETDCNGPIVVDKAIRLAEEVSGYKGWHYVKYSSSASTLWFPAYESREIIPQITHKYIFDDYGSFDKPFPEEWDEIIFIRDDNNMYRTGSQYGVQYSYMTREQSRNIITRNLNWTSTTIKKTQNGYNENIYFFNLFSDGNYDNQSPFIMCKDRNSSIPSDIVYHEQKNIITDSPVSSVWTPRSNVTQYTDIYVLVRNSNAYNVRISSIIPIPYYTDRTKYLQYYAEQASGVKGWRIVRYLPYGSSGWHPYNDNLTGTSIYGTPYDYTSAFSVSFGTYDEFLFSTGGLKHWLHTTKHEAVGNNYSSGTRRIIKSSIIPSSYYATWHNRGSANPEDPWIGLRSHNTSPINDPYNGGDMILYSENGLLSSPGNSLPVLTMDDGMCVFVRDSSNPVSEYSYDTEYKILKFEHSKGNEIQTEYTIDFPEKTICDILVIGGGGGGGTRYGGGGGAGLLIYKQNQIIKGSVIVKVGKGGLQAQNGNGSHGKIGMDSLLISNFESLIAKGGGGGGHESVNGDDGGSGGGGSYDSSLGGSGYGDDLYEFGNNGSNGYNGGGSGTRVTGGGGGAGGSGIGGAVVTGLQSPDGGIGKQYDISGILTYYAGGGGGANSDFDSWGYDAMGIGGLGGGGNGGQSSPSILAEDGKHGTGGGGGGGVSGTVGGNGGNGIVIIKYKEFTVDKMVQWTYKSENTDVYMMGNVSIKKDITPSTFDVNGNISSTNFDVDGDITATDKNFKIYHPLGYNKWLYHSSIEAPRYDNIYRGKKTIIKGICEVDIDRECNETGGMSEGTFVALNRNPQLYLRNNKTFDKVRGEIFDGKIKIYSENTKDKIEIDWMIMAERQDKNIKQSLLTNNDGNLICEKNRIL